MLEDSETSAPCLLRLSRSTRVTKAFLVLVGLQKLCLSSLLKAYPVLFVMLFNSAEPFLLFLSYSWYLLCTISPGTLCTTA